MHSRGSTGARHGVAPVLPKEVLKTSSKRARANGAGAPSPPRTETPFTAPPCYLCGKPFSQEWLADPEIRRMALASEMAHEECEAAMDAAFAARRARGDAL